MPNRPFSSPAALTGLAVLAAFLGGCSAALPVSSPEPAAPEVALVAFPDEAVTPPGTDLALGDPAWLPSVARDAGDELVGYALLDIIEGDSSFWETFSNPEAFAGHTPYFVIMQEVRSESVSPTLRSVYPVYADRTDAYVIENATIAIAAVSCPDYVVANLDEHPGYASCFVAAGEGGNPVSGVRFDGTGSETTLAPTDDPYFAAPVHWMAG